MNEEIALNLFDESGNLRDINNVIEDLKGIYESIENQESCCKDSLLMTLVNPEISVDTEMLFNKYEIFERKIYIDSEITEKTGRKVLEKIQLWNSCDDVDKVSADERLPIQIYIDTPGGSLVSAYQIIDAISSSKTPIYTIVTGAAYSAGFLIAISGHKKYGFEHSSYLLHEGSVINAGDAHKALQFNDYYKYQLNQLKEMVLDKTKISTDVYDQHRKDDWYFNAASAIEYGIIDKVITDVNGGIYDED